VWASGLLFVSAALNFAYCFSCLFPCVLVFIPGRNAFLLCRSSDLQQTQHAKCCDCLVCGHLFNKASPSRQSIIYHSWLSAVLYSHLFWCEQWCNGVQIIILISSFVWMLYIAVFDWRATSAYYLHHFEMTGWKKPVNAIGMGQLGKDVVGRTKVFSHAKEASIYIVA